MPADCGVAPAVCPCALAQIRRVKNQNRTAVNRQILFADDIDLETFQQGTFGPDAILKMSVAEDTPAEKNCGVRVKMASKTYPSLCWRMALLFLESSGPLRITVDPDKFARDDGYDTRPLLPTVAELPGSLLKGERIV